MTLTMSFLILTVAVALIFDLINGFHDAANSIATIVSTRVLKPRVAVLWAAFFNFVAIFIFAPRVADTISKIIKVPPGDPVYIIVIMTGLLGAIAWNIFTWWSGLPTSSSHALIGGLSGAGIAHAGWQVLQWDKIILTIQFIILAPLLGFILGSLLILALYWICRRYRPAAIDAFFRKGQLFSAALYSIGHGGNDAQKTMGIIMAVLVAGGTLQPGASLSFSNPDTAWIVISCNAAMSIGTAFGGWRIVKTMGMKITKLKPIGGFCAETAGALTLFLATSAGIPVSTTHTITGAIVGVGSVNRRVSAVRWGVARRIVWAWLITLPASALIAAGCFWLYNLFV